MVKSLVFSVGIIAVASISLFTGCGSDSSSQQDISKVSSKLDKAYTPALFFSNISPMPNQAIASSANSTLKTLESSWSSFKTDIGTTYGATNVGSYYSSVDKEINNATKSLQDVINTGNYPSDISTIHLSLESVRDTLSSMRKDISVNYFIDALTKAHHAMEPVSGAAKLYSSGTSSLEQLCTGLNSSLTLFNTEWKNLENSYDESTIAKLYGFSDAKSKNITNNINAMANILTSLSTALTTCDSSTATEANKVKPTFVKMFLGFGDFLTPFKAEMITMEKSFVSALYCTNNPPDIDKTCGGVDGTKSLINSFETNSNAFQGKYPVIAGKLNLPGSLYWSSYFTNIKSSTDKVKTISDSAVTAADFITAHDELEKVRTSMYNLRWTYENYSFVTDNITDYHGAMEPIAIAVKGLSDASQIDQNVKDAISNSLTIAQSSLNSLNSSVKSMNNVSFGFDSAWHTTQLSSLDEQVKNLSSLKAALTANNTVDILKYAQLVKPKFVPLFKAFGSF